MGELPLASMKRTVTAFEQAASKRVSCEVCVDGPSLGYISWRRHHLPRRLTGYDHLRLNTSSHGVIIVLDGDIIYNAG